LFIPDILNEYVIQKSFARARPPLLPVGRRYYSTVTDLARFLGLLRLVPLQRNVITEQLQRDGVYEGEIVS